MQPTVHVPVFQSFSDVPNHVAEQYYGYCSVDKQLPPCYIPALYSEKECLLPRVPDDKDAMYYHKPDRLHLPATADAEPSHLFLPPYGHFHKAVGLFSVQSLVLPVALNNQPSLSLTFRFPPWLSFVFPLTAGWSADVSVLSATSLVLQPMTDSQRSSIVPAVLHSPLLRHSASLLPAARFSPPVQVAEILPPLYDSTSDLKNEKIIAGVP